MPYKIVVFFAMEDDSALTVIIRYTMQLTDT